MLNSKFWIWPTRPTRSYVLELSLPPTPGYHLCFNVCPRFATLLVVSCLCVFACEVSSSWDFHLPVSPTSSDQLLCIPLVQLLRYLGEEPSLPHRLGEHSSWLRLDLYLTQHNLHHLEPKLLFIYLSLLRNHLLLENKGCFLVLCFWESNTASDMLGTLNKCFLSWILLKGKGQAILGSKIWQFHSASQLTDFWS